MHELTKLKEQFSEKGILICFNGPFSQSIIEEIGNAVRKYLETEEARKDAVLDVFAVYIEQTQNVKNYLASTGFSAAEQNAAIMTIARKEGKYILSSGNMIRKSDTAPLVERIEQINRLDKSGLRRLYREQMRREVSPGVKGAGVGLIEIARRASNKLSYVVDGIDETCDFFILSVDI